MNVMTLGDRCLACATVAAMVLFMMWVLSCANGPAERLHWHRCGLGYHEECTLVEDFRACEYEFYKECVEAE